MYIIVYNVGYRDAILYVDFNGFIEEYGTREAAEEEAKKNIDGEYFRNFEIFKKA